MKPEQERRKRRQELKYKSSKELIKLVLAIEDQCRRLIQARDSAQADADNFRRRLEEVGAENERRRGREAELVARVGKERAESSIVHSQLERLVRLVRQETIARALVPVEVLVPAAELEKLCAAGATREGAFRIGVARVLKRRKLKLEELVEIGPPAFYELEGTAYFRVLYGKPAPPEKQERDVKADVCELLDRMHLTWVRLAAGTGSVTVRGSGEGTPDLLVRLPPAARMLAIETKCSHPDTCGCDSCKAQREWRDKHLAEGGLYLLCRHPVDLLRFLREVAG